MHHFVKSSKDFRETVLEELGFIPYKQSNCILYKNPDQPQNGHFLFYERPGYYSFGIADYTVSHPFMISFHNPERLVRFGTVYHGTTNFKLEKQPVSSFKPSSFFVIEKDIKGKQAWSTSQHFHGAEFIIHEAYFNKVLKTDLKTDFDFEKFSQNFTYHYLPLEVMDIMKKLQALATHNELTPIFLESYLLKCIATLIQIIEDSPDNTFSKQLYYGKVKIGKDKYIHLTSEDIRAIQTAHTLITENIQSPPTIEHLSTLVHLNTQKLKAGFAHYYHLPIGQFITSTRMSIAANILCTTDESIEAIGQKVGYPYPSNFIKMFKKTYKCTPLEYRRNSRT